MRLSGWSRRGEGNTALPDSSFCTNGVKELSKMFLFGISEILMESCAPAAAQDSIRISDIPNKNILLGSFTPLVQNEESGRAVFPSPRRDQPDSLIYAKRMETKR